MNLSKAFLLGLYSIGGQVLLLRELVSSFNGDELFIGWALFGWLLAVALGSSVGGRIERKISSAWLFIVGALLLVLTVPAVRLSPLLIGGNVGEVAPFTTAVLVSTAAMLPVGLLSGWLFAALAREGWHTEQAVVTVYLWEGLGAFVGGVLAALLVGEVLSNLALTVSLAVVVAVAVLSIRFERRRAVAWSTVAVGIPVLLAVPWFTGGLDKRLGRIKYPQYRVLDAFDSHYGRHSLLSRDEMVVLLSDNKAEAAYPDVATAENLLIPALLCNPQAHDVLYFGRGEFGPAQLVSSFPEIQLTSVDPRRSLTAAVDAVLPFPGSPARLNEDPVSYLAERAGHDWYDVIIADVGEPDNYRTGRLLTREFFARARGLLKDGGLLVVPTGYDTDRYVSEETATILAILRNSLAASFKEVVLWPGTQTLLLASDRSFANTSIDSMAATMEAWEYQPSYLSESFLRDRLDEFKRERLEQSLAGEHRTNDAARPLLVHLQGLYRARSGFDRALFVLAQNPAAALVVVLTPLLVILVGISFGREKRRRFGLFLYFAAGLVSISLELLSFYVYQTTAGSLYAEVAALVGAFMLGLAGGTYCARRLQGRHLEYPAVVVLLVAVAVFLLTWQWIDVRVMLAYHLMFLFVVALATGSLFVAATHRYYEERPLANRGVGYAVELIGSALGAVFTLTVLLPAVGISWVLILLGGVLVAALVGAVCTERCY